MRDKSPPRIPDVTEIKYFRKIILRRFRRHRRNYPWRETNDPFKILIAEMMLQRTPPDQVTPVYKSFFSKFKSAGDVATTTMKQLKTMMKPLGLRWRIKRFKEVSDALVKDFGGKVPDTKQDIIKLPGVGDYVAGIVLSTAFGKKEWIVDSNVVRVFKRYFAINTSKEGRRDRHVVEMAKVYASGRSPRNANIGILDFAATICAPAKPKCERCPLSRSCHYFTKRCGGP